ncbi:AAA family ATPase [Algoriphagus namhaensis]|uniref:AAA family ATPase n=1 Tax=Algoriphagus namhaensis TaxID=915353 RepID=A0ABV8AQI5_9BACT
MAIKKILILGPESTGKSTLAQDLSTYYGEPWVPEYAREYLQNLSVSYDFEDLSTIAKGQIALEDQKEKEAKKFLFCDTDLRVIHIWSEYKYGKTASWIVDEIARRNYDLILLTDIDMPWEEDPQREHPEPEMRAYFFNQYLKLAEESEFPFELMSGSQSERLKGAIQIIDQRF